MSDRQPMGLPVLLRRLNTADVLGEIRSNGPISRASVAKATGLSQLTVNQIANGLLRAGYVIEERGDSRPLRSRRGRRTGFLRFNATTGYVLGIDIAPQAVIVLLADLNGKIVADEQRRIDRRAQLHPMPLLSLVRIAVRATLGRGGVSRSRVIAVGVGVPGRVDPLSGRISFVPALPGWDGLILRNRLGRSLACPIVVENDMHLAILAERGFGSARADGNAVYLHLGVGVGLGVLVHGELYRGAAGAAGEIAFLHVCDVEESPEGDFGTFEWAAGSTAFTRLGRRAAASSPGGLISALARGDLHRIDAQIVVEAARQGDADANAILENLAKRLARGVSAVQCMLDPGTIILGGEVSHAGPLLLERLKAQILTMTRPPVGKIVVSSLGEQVVALGAVQVALRQVEQRLFAVSPRALHLPEADGQRRHRARIRSKEGIV
jgi:predicted NBD/HSP70 family sugar kinase